jgi:hypothetical protein
MKAAAHCIGFHADSDQIIASKAIQSVFPADSHVSILWFFAKKNCGAGKGVLQGVLRFHPRFWVVKRGEVVVKRVVKRGGWDGSFRVLKIFQLAQLYFLWRVVRS